MGTIKIYLMEINMVKVRKSWRDIVLGMILEGYKKQCLVWGFDLNKQHINIIWPEKLFYEGGICSHG